MADKIAIPKLCNDTNTNSLLKVVGKVKIDQSNNWIIGITKPNNIGVNIKPLYEYILYYLIP